MNQDLVEDWKTNVEYLLRDYAERDRWNIDVTGLGFPRTSLLLAGEHTKGGKLSKERLTIGLLVSARGEKFKPIVIAKSAMPKAFNNISLINCLLEIKHKSMDDVIVVQRVSDST